MNFLVTFRSEHFQSEFFFKVCFVLCGSFCWVIFFVCHLFSFIFLIKIVVLIFFKETKVAYKWFERSASQCGF